MQGVVYLTVWQVEAYHAQALKEHGGLDGVRSREALESAVAQPQQSAFSEDAYPTPAEKAAAPGNTPRPHSLPLRFYRDR